MYIRNVLRIGMRLSTSYIERRVISPNYLTLENRRRLFSTEIPNSNSQAKDAGESNNSGSKKALGKLEGKLQLTFTCKKCQTRNSKIISKIGYESGVVIVRCTGCKNNHLIADNLGWYPELKGNTNIEMILATKGEKVRRIMNYDDGYFEAVAEQEFEKMKLQSDQAQQQEVEEEQENVRKLEYEKVGTPVKT